MKRHPLPLIVLVLAVAAVAVWAMWLREKPLPVTTTSREAFQWYEKGMENTDKLFWGEAVQSFEQAVALDSTFAMAWKELSTARRSIGDEEGAKEAIERAYHLRDEVTEIERLLIDYSYDLSLGKHEESKTVLEEMARKYPDDVRVVLLRARRAWSSGDRDQAILLYEKSLALDPNRVMCHNQLGYLYLDKDDFPTAIANLQRYAYYADDQPNPHDSLGEAYQAAGQYDKAIQEYVKALEIRPSFYQSAVHLATALAITGQIERARYTLSQAENAMTELGISTRFILPERMHVEHLAMQPEKVLEISDREADRHPSDDPSSLGNCLNIQVYRSFALLELHRVDEAAVSLERTAGYWREFLEKWGDELGPSSLKLGEIVGRILEAKLLLAQGLAWQPVAQEIAGAIDQAPFPCHRKAFLRYDLSQIDYDGGNDAAALEQANKILAVIPTFPYLNLLAAKAHARLGHDEEAIGHLKVYLKVMAMADEDHPGVIEARELLARLQARR